MTKIYWICVLEHILFLSVSGLILSCWTDRMPHDYRVKPYRITVIENIHCKINK